MDTALLKKRLLAPAEAFLDFVAPPVCLSCGAAAASPAGLCGRCWITVEFMEEPLCACCGRTFAYSVGSDALCAACIASPPPYARARAVMRYGDVARNLVLGYKHGDRGDLVRAFVPWLARSGGVLLQEADVIVPVPLHWRRLAQRRFNQAALLASRLSQVSGKPAANRVLRRRRHTPPQGHMSRPGRQRNVQGAFEVRSRMAPLCAGRRVLLIDDVMTTGATAAACSRALLKAGASAVDVLTIARVL